MRLSHSRRSKYIIWGERESFTTVAGNANRMFILGSQRPIARNGGPAIRENFDAGLAQIDHWLDCEDHTFLHLHTIIGCTIMENVGGIVKKLAHAVAAEIPDH